MNACYAFEVHDGSPLIVDWGSTIEGFVGDVICGRPAGEISAKFHNTLAEIVRAVALRVGEAKIVLTGGCFQNRHLTESVFANALLDAGFQPVLAPARTAQRWGNLSGASRRRRGSASSESCSKINLPPHELALRRDHQSFFRSRGCRWE